MSRKYFVAYLTANDTPYFHIDYFNLINMFIHDPGVEHVHLYVAVSEVNPINYFQKRLLNAILREADRCKWLTCNAGILKPNTGRDFSSLHECLLAMSGHASDEDFILVRNRSSRGPFTLNWYKKYIDQSSLKRGIGMTGSTINLNDHFTRGLKQNVAHVQTYVFLSQWKYLAPLLPDFPGIHVRSHIDAVMHGEIELSQRILKAGAMITSLQKPNMVLDIHSQNDPVQFTHKPQLEFSQMPVIHRKRHPRDLRFWINRLGYFKIIWFLLKNRKSLLFIDKTRHI